MGTIIPSFGSREMARSDPFSQLQREVDRLFGEFSRGMPALGWPFAGEGALTPSIDVSETDQSLELTAELPGVEEKDIDVTLSNNLLTIKAEKKAEKESKDKTYHLVERSYGAVRRTISVPFDADPDKVEARFDKGVLKVTLPKPPGAAKKERSIKIKAA
ncbi:MAG: Hsp20/alpha crystallin family protein [Hyphomicrobiales bacterium]|jgi:HSP20 family protein|nr:Hsp20/alpha crystallin family protein [Hyphomicrobiales bacterium]